MKELNDMLNCLKDKTEETFKFYAQKEHWTPEDIESVEKAAKAYDRIQNIQMNNGIWDEMQRTGDYSYGRNVHLSYGRDGRGYGRSYGRHDRYYDEMEHAPYSYSYGDGRHGNMASAHSVKDQAIQRLESLMDHAESDYERQEIMEMIKKIEADRK